jgi:asparagine N-glycosylation enzyme membrane subunit Stt3
MSYRPPQGWPPHGFGQPPPYLHRKQSRGNGFAIASIIVGVVGCLAGWVGFGLFAIPVMAIGLALGIVALKDARQGHRSGKVMAIVGIVLCALALVLAVAWIAFLLKGLIDSGEIP